MNYHDPVLLNPSIDGLDIKPDGVYVDVTFGGGGHSRQIMERLGQKGKLFAFDQDLDAIQNSIDDPRFVLINANFRDIKTCLKAHAIDRVDGILADLGVSSYQFDQPERGFSIRFDSKLDMRMNQGLKRTAFHVVNSYEESKLADVLFNYGELRNSRKIARKIADSRRESKIETSGGLIEVVGSMVPKKNQNKFLAQIFQAIRIEVNQELDVLREFLEQIPQVLNQNGRVSVISYHSLEDRLVKRFIRYGMFEGEPKRDVFGNYTTPLKPVGKLIVPDEQEIKVNNRARSAKLRIGERL